MPRLTVHPQRIEGTWKAGYALDVHTRSSDFAGYDEFGHAVFDTVRSDVGEALYQVKYGQDAEPAESLAAAAASFVRRWKCGVDVLVPVPSSKKREVAPVRLVGRLLAQKLGIPFVADAVRRTREIPELKNVHDFRERKRLLAGVHALVPAKVRGRTVLLFDDLYRSGATMNVIASALIEKGQAKAVFALALTRTRSSR